MKVIPIVTAVLVSAILFLVVFERDRLLGFAQTTPEVQATEDVTGTQEVAVDNAVGVVAIASVAQIVDRAVILRGQTEAARQVTIAAETSGGAL